MGVRLEYPQDTGKANSSSSSIDFPNSGYMVKDRTFESYKFSSIGGFLNISFLTEKGG